MPPNPEHTSGAAPAPPRRAAVRRAAAVLATAGLVAAVAAPAPAAAADGRICHTFCDARGPAHALKDRTPATTTPHGRSAAPHIDDAGGMALGTVDNVVAGDKAGVDRSSDGGRTGDRGRTGDGGRRLGDTTAPRRQAAATALMKAYDRRTGLFGGDGWWTGANALTAVIDTMRRTGDQRYAYAVHETYDKNKDRTDGGRLGQFRNEYLDDTGWWGLAWIKAYDLTGDARYLDTARADADHMAGYWTGKCGGGVQWKTDTAYKNAVTNELYIALNAALHQRTTGDTRYLDRAKGGWNWLRGSGMINGKHLVNDGLNDSCRNNGQPTWTYNQGVILGALAELHQATGDDGPLRSARELADASTGSAALNPGGILREPNESNGCTGDGPSFKGAYVRGLGALNRELAGHPYDGYLAKQADTAYAKDRDPLDRYGPHWNGDRGDGPGYGCQHSALDLLNAAP